MQPLSQVDKRLIGYVRVSTDEQADSGAGLAAQQAALERAFEYEGWELAELVRDEGASGKDLDRPGLRRALQLIVEGEADGIVVAKLDRLTLGERTKNAMAAMRAAGQTTGRPAIADHPELNERIHELHDENRSLSEIARILNQEGWPTVRGGKVWRHSAVQNALGYQRPPRRRRRAELPVIPRRRRIAA